MIIYDEDREQLYVDSCRIGDFEFRPTFTLIGDRYYEIVRWEPNHYYGKESEYDVELDSSSNIEWYIPKNRSEYITHRISPGCFKMPETCYTIATFKHSGDSFDLESVGSRIISSVKNETEREDLWNIIKEGFSRLEKLELINNKKL